MDADTQVLIGELQRRLDNTELEVRVLRAWCAAVAAHSTAMTASPGDDIETIRGAVAGEMTMFMQDHLHDRPLMSRLQAMIEAPSLMATDMVPVFTGE